MTTLAVVPIVVNAGAALLPALLAGAVSFAALLLRPRELVRTCRERPGKAAGVALLLVLLGTGGWWMVAGSSHGNATTRAGATGSERIDWAAVAVELIRQEQGGGASATTTQPIGTTDGPIVFRHDYARRGIAAGAIPAKLQQGWRFQKDTYLFLSSPAVRDGKVYAAGCLLDLTNNYGLLVCLDAATGKPLWQQDKLGGRDLKGFFSSPALSPDGKYVVIGQGLHFDKDSDLICVEAATGKLHWRIPTPLHLEGSPAVFGDMAVAGAGAIERKDGKPADPPGFVIAVRISDGKELWRHTVRDPESSPAIGPDGTVYIGSGVDGNAVVALRSEPDEVLAAQKLPREKWRAGLPYPGLGAVTLAGELVLIGGGRGNYAEADPNPAGVVAAFDRQTGKAVWQENLEDAVLGPIAAGDGVAVCGLRNGEVIALDLKSGKPRWRQRVSGKSPVLAGPAFDGQRIVAVAGDGILAILNAKDGQVLQKLNVNDPQTPGEMGLSVSSPVVAGGRVFVGSETGGLRCLVE